MTEKQRLVIGISGASGAVYGIELLKTLRSIPTIETHLILSKNAQLTIAQETSYTVENVKEMADHTHAFGNVGACVASGSYKTMGMVIAPCSIRTMSAIATGLTGDLLTRSADVMLKERRPLILLVRETPLHLGHLRTMTALAEMGAVILPPVPAFYTHPQSVNDIVQHTVGRTLDLLGIDTPLVKRWQGLEKNHE